MNVVESVHGERVDLARVLKRHKGIRRIVEDLYPDSAHFIYELLQNAEDTAATEASFVLRKNCLVFEHNGRPFDRRDIEAITDIGEGAKSTDDDKIGRFGVGFKAVFAYTETPHIWSPTYSFKITDLVLPKSLPPNGELGGITHFEFPFDNPEKTPQDAFREIEAGLADLAETTLLFLSHLRLIRWRIHDDKHGEVSRIEHSVNHVEVVQLSGGETVDASHYLKFERPVEALEKQSVAVAYELDFLPNVTRFDTTTPLHKQMKIVPARPGRVAVFFPAEKETSGLRFHVHGPFVPELSRASVKDTPANEPLFEQLAALIADSLLTIRDLGLLSTGFLAVLPNPHDQIPSRYGPITEAIINSMNDRPLTPTYRKFFAPAKRLLQAKAALKELLTDQDLAFLAGQDEPRSQWAVTAPQRNSDADRFLSALSITRWDVDQFVERLVELSSEPNPFRSPPFDQGPDIAFMEWLADKSADWHQRMYSLLYSELGPARRFSPLMSTRIVRLDNGEYSVGRRCYFPNEGVEHDDLVQRVNPNVYSSGKSEVQRESARKFLEEIGVREVNEAVEIEWILKRRYVRSNFKPLKGDLQRFVSFLEKNPAKAQLFANYFIFECADGRWRRPTQIFLDVPFQETFLSAYYEARRDDRPRVALARRYTDCGIAKKALVKFAVSVGAQTRLEIATEVRCFSNPQYAYLRQVGGQRRTSPINRDYAIDGFDALLDRWSVELARFLWHTMSFQTRPHVLRATYRKNESWGSRQADSQLVHQLKNAAWVPQGADGPFVRPKDASRDLLPDGFPFDPGSAWLKAIGFGDEIAKRTERQREKETIAKELGFIDATSLDRARRFAALSPERQDRILARWERTPETELPDHESANPRRRAKRVGTDAGDAPERRTEERTRSVSISRDEVKQEAAQYLAQQYTNADGELICQVCKAPMPFRLDDGTDYFEKVEFLPELTRRHYQNYLALCPNHSAMFQYANGSTDSMRSTLEQLNGNNFQIVLAQKDDTIYFTKTHVADLREIVKVDGEETHSAFPPDGSE